MFLSYRESGFDFCMSGSSEIGRLICSPASDWCRRKTTLLSHQIEGHPGSLPYRLRALASEAVVEVLYISSIMGLL